MRRRAWLAWGCLAAGLLVGSIGRLAHGGKATDVVSGLLVLVAAILGLTLLPFWRSVLPRLDPMPGLFQRPSARERWCGRCGHPTPSAGPCLSCGHTPASRGR